MYKLGKEGNMHEVLVWIRHFTYAFHSHNTAVGYYYFCLRYGKTETWIWGYIICLNHFVFHQQWTRVPVVLHQNTLASLVQGPKAVQSGGEYFNTQGVNFFDKECTAENSKSESSIKIVFSSLLKFSLGCFPTHVQTLKYTCAHIHNANLGVWGITSSSLWLTLLSFMVKNGLQIQDEYNRKWEVIWLLLKWNI